MTDKERILRAIEALSTIANWKLPSTGEFWDDEKTRPVSYEVNWGSNGTRDYIRSVARAAIEDILNGSDNRF